MKKIITILSLFIAFCSLGQIESVNIDENSNWCPADINNYVNSVQIFSHDCNCLEISIIIKFEKNGDYWSYDNYTTIDSSTIRLSLYLFDNYYHHNVINNNTNEYYDINIQNNSQFVSKIDLDIDDSLIVCDFYDKDLKVKFDNQEYLTTSLTQNNYEYRIYKNGVESSETYNLDLNEGDSLYVTYNGQHSYTDFGCVTSDFQELTTPTYVVHKKENPVTQNAEIYSGNETICPFDTSDIRVITPELGYRWYTVNNDSSLSYYSYKDSLSFSKPKKLTYASSNNIENNECPTISNIIDVKADTTCSAIITGNINESGTYQNGNYNTLPNVKVITNTGLVTYSNDVGYYKFTLTNQEYDAVNKISIASPKYNQYSRTKYASSSDFRLYNADLTTYLLEDSDLKVTLSSGRNRPGFTIPYTVTIENRGKDTLTTNVSTLIDNNLTYTSYDGESTPNTINGQNLTWNNITVNKGETKRLRFYATLDRTTTLGDTLQSSASITVTDDVVENNTYNYSPIVTGSYDPNDKLVSYTGAFHEGYITDTTSFEYTIRFQNSGTDTAFTVIVTDIIDKDLDLTSLEVIDASHQYAINYAHDTISWTFSNILLPDSNTNEPASHGYIRFTINQKDNNEQGTVIDNKAYIYFDFNDPIITNEVTSIIDNNRVILSEVERIENFAQSNISVYPNPVKNKLKFKTDGNASVIIFNALGDVMLETNITNKSSIDTQNWSNGVYFYQITDTEGNAVSDKFVKE